MILTATTAIEPQKDNSINEESNFPIKTDARLGSYP